MEVQKKENPGKQIFNVYPTCRTCKHFDTFVGATMEKGTNICVLNPPRLQAQIVGQDKNGDTVWSSHCGWPTVLAHQRCSKHEPNDGSKN